MGGAQYSNGHGKRQIEMAFFLVCICGLISLSCAGRLSGSRQKLQVDKHLKRLNKPPIKTIEVTVNSNFHLDLQFSFALLFSLIFAGFGKSEGKASEVELNIISALFFWFLSPFIPSVSI